MQMINISVHLHDAGEETTSEALHKRKEKWISNSERFCNVDTCSKYRVMPQRIRTMSEFNKGRIVAYRSVDYRSVISPVSSIEIQTVSSEYGITAWRRVILSGM